LPVADMFMHLFYRLIIKQQKYVLETGGCQVDACPGEYSVLFVMIFAHIHTQKEAIHVP